MFADAGTASPRVDGRTTPRRPVPRQRNVNMMPNRGCVVTGSSVCRPAGVLLALWLTAAVAGCGGAPQLMPTPNVYASGARDPFPDVPPDLRNNRADVLYLTD